MKLDFEKMGGLIPAIVQDYNTNKVLMLGFMNEEAYEETKAYGTYYWDLTPSPSICWGMPGRSWG